MLSPSKAFSSPTMLPTSSLPSLPPKLHNLVSPTTRRKILTALLPSFLLPSKKSAKPEVKPQNGVSALDGLRGIACLFVVNEHLTYNFSEVFLHSWAPGQTYWMMQWPFIRIMWTGWSMVNVFFVISGYVLTYKPFRQLHNRDFHGARATLASGTFRRAMRLYFPMWSAVLLCAFCTWLGFYNRAIVLYHTDDNVYRLHEGPPLHFNSLYKQMSDAIYYGLRQLNIINFKDGDLHSEHYDKHTWTIPVEFKCSLILFASVLAVSQLKPQFRLFSLSFIAAVLIHYKNRNPFLFLTGALLADIDHHIKGIFQRQQQLEFNQNPSRFERFVLRWLHPDSKFWPVLFTWGIYILCVPVHNWDTDPFYKDLLKFVPFQHILKGDRWLRVYGAIIVVWAVANSTVLKPIFVNRFSTYLGKVSFALYLVHGDVFRSVLFAAIPHIYSITGDGTYKNQTAGSMFTSWLLGGLVSIPLSFWLADLFCRYIDEPSTRLARRIETYMLDQEIAVKHEDQRLK